MSINEDSVNLDVDLLELGKNHFRSLIEEFASYGVQANPKMELREGKGMLCYYDLNDGHVYLSTPSLSGATGKIQLLFLRSMLGFENDEDLIQLFELLIPHVIAHELAHHFRHRYGLFGDNMWNEEQIANQLAIAVTKKKLSRVQKEKLRNLLEKAINSLETRLEVHDLGSDSYYSIWHTLNVSGQIGDSALEYMELAHKLFAIDPATMLKSSGQLSQEISQLLMRREDIIEQINEEYATDYMRYLYYQLSWIYLDLVSHEMQYVESFARLHLDINAPMLPIIPEIPAPSEDAIMACYKAHVDTQPISEAISYYFYKRYRSLLLKRLQLKEFSLPGQTERLRKEATFLLQNWDGRQSEADMLNYLSHLAHPSLRDMFPHEIADNLPRHFPVQFHLPTETDKRLWRHTVLGEYDQGAVNTGGRLNILHQVEIYRSLPAEVMLELTHSFCRVKLAPGETIIWQGEVNNDVYILIEGKLEVFLLKGNRKRYLGLISLGEVFGEMAFFTRERRNATVRAIEASECFVLKDSDLHLFAFKYPSVLMQMARILTKRLEDNQQNRIEHPTQTLPIVKLPVDK